MGLEMRFSLFALLLAPLLQITAAPVIEAFGELPADTMDGNGETLGGIGSGIVYDRANDVYLMISDRGPGDGTLPYRPRIAVLKITQEGETLLPVLLETILLKDEDGRAMTGLIPDDATSELPQMRDGRTCIDPEALALTRDGRIYITDEYGPFLYEFQRDGVMVRRILLPSEFQPRDETGNLNFTDAPSLTSGRAVNQGPEGMCLLPGETQAALIFQSASVQDGGKAVASTKLLILDLESGLPTAIYRYQFSTEAVDTKASELSVNDLVALDDSRFLVLERDGKGRDGSKTYELPREKSVWLADARHATNLIGTPPGAGIKPMTKKRLFNLATLVKDPQSLAAKWEGLAVIPPSDDKKLTLLMTADNDFLTPLIHEDGKTYPFPRTEDPVPTQFYKIRVQLPGGE